MFSSSSSPKNRKFAFSGPFHEVGFRFLSPWPFLVSPHAPRGVTIWPHTKSVHIETLVEHVTWVALSSWLPARAWKRLWTPLMWTWTNHLDFALPPWNESAHVPFVTNLIAAGAHFLYRLEAASQKCDAVAPPTPSLEAYVNVTWICERVISFLGCVMSVCRGALYVVLLCLCLIE